jgi:asparagine synthase (glutamine-hydrolysing)
VSRWLVLNGADHGGRARIEAQAGALGLIRRHHCRAFTLLADPDASVLLDVRNNVTVIGRLFERAGFGKIDQIDEGVISAITETSGSCLATRYWGSYVALAADGVSGDVRILRDPSGALPVYYTRAPSVWIVSSDARLLAAVAPAKFPIDYAAVAARLARPGHHMARTALAGVSELLPGFMMAIGRDIHVDAFWRPWDHVSIAPVTPATLRQTVDCAIGALANLHDRILVTVSGGLDSSIIAASLAGQGHDVALLTMATGDPRGDERGYVRLLADARGLDFAWHGYDHGDIDIVRASSAHQPWPGARTFAQGYDRCRQRHAEAIGAGAIFSGDGGDNVFGLTMSASPVVDRLRADGIGPAIRTSVDIAKLTACSVPAVWRSALARLWRRGGALGSHDASFLSTWALAIAECVPDHPWMAPDVPLLPGKAAHIASIMRTQRYAHGYAPGAAEAVLPLIAQPVVETCLSIPSWRWCEGGENRAVARSAYAEILPPEIIHRRTKGGPDSFCVELVERYRPAIREMLLDGLLAGNGLLDRGTVAASLDGGHAERSDLHRVLAFVDTEAWVRSWT